METHSRAVARLIVDYDDAAREVADEHDRAESSGAAEDQEGFEAPVLGSLSDILNMVASLDLPMRLYEEATLSVERRWEDRAFPGHELTEALAHAYSFLSRLIRDAHARAGVAHGAVVEIEGDVVPLPAETTPEGRLPCMVTSRALRTVSFHVKDGRIATGGRMWSMRPDAARARIGREKYKLEPGDSQPLGIDTILDLGDWYTARAKAILRTGEEHGWFLFLFRGPTPVDARVLHARDAADKRALAQEVADLVAINGIDGVVDIGEMWQSPITKAADGAFVRPAEHPEREESVGIHIELADGRARNIQVPFTRRRGRRRRVHVLPPIEMEQYKNNFLEPVRAVWQAKVFRRRRWRLVPSSCGVRSRDPRRRNDDVMHPASVKVLGDRSPDAAGARPAGGRCAVPYGSGGGVVTQGRGREETETSCRSTRGIRIAPSLSEWELQQPVLP